MTTTSKLVVGGIEIDVYPVGLLYHLQTLGRVLTVRRPRLRGHRLAVIRNQLRQIHNGTLAWIRADGSETAWLHGFHAEPAEFAGFFEFADRCGIGWTTARATADLLGHARGGRA